MRIRTGELLERLAALDSGIKEQEVRHLAILIELVTHSMYILDTQEEWCLPDEMWDCLEMLSVDNYYVEHSDAN